MANDSFKANRQNRLCAIWMTRWLPGLQRYSSAIFINFNTSSGVICWISCWLLLLILPSSLLWLLTAVVLWPPPLDRIGFNFFPITLILTLIDSDGTCSYLDSIVALMQRPILLIILNKWIFVDANLQQNSTFQSFAQLSALLSQDRTLSNSPNCTCHTHTHGQTDWAQCHKQKRKKKEKTKSITIAHWWWMRKSIASQCMRTDAHTSHQQFLQTIWFRLFPFQTLFFVSENDCMLCACVCMFHVCECVILPLSLALKCLHMPFACLSNASDVSEE